MDVLLLEVELAMPAALPAASCCTDCVSWLSRSESSEELLLAAVVLPVPAALLVLPVLLVPEALPLEPAAISLCNWLTRAPALDWNCCRLTELLPPDICANRVVAAAVWLPPPAAAELLFRKFVNSPWLMLPLPSVSMEENRLSSVCARLELLLLPLVPLGANSEL